jgi:hypothetical protein
MQPLVNTRFRTCEAGSLSGHRDWDQSSSQLWTYQDSRSLLLNTDLLECIHSRTSNILYFWWTSLSELLSLFRNRLFIFVYKFRQPFRNSLWVLIRRVVRAHHRFHPGIRFHLPHLPQELPKNVVLGTER